jgi:hypothetical protein
MTEAEALDRAWTALRKCGSEQEVTGLKSIRLSTVAEVREFLEIDNPDITDTWYVCFQLKLESGVVHQHPDDILISIDDSSGEATLHWQM